MADPMASSGSVVFSPSAVIRLPFRLMREYQLPKSGQSCRIGKPTEDQHENSQDQGTLKIFKKVIS